MCYSTLQNLVGLQPNGIAEPVVFQTVEQYRDGEGSICPQILAPDTGLSVSLNDRGKYRMPIIGTANIASTQATSFQITMLVEYKQRVIAGAAKMAVVG